MALGSTIATRGALRSASPYNRVGTHSAPKSRPTPQRDFTPKGPPSPGHPYKGDARGSGGEGGHGEGGSDAPWKNQYTDPLEGLLESEIRAYISGERGLGQDWINKAFENSRVQLDELKEGVVETINKSAVSRGIYESGLPVEQRRHVESDYLKDLSNIRTGLELSTEQYNKGLQQYGMGQGMNMAQFRSNRALGYAGMQNQQQLAHIQGDYGLQQAQMQITAASNLANAQMQAAQSSAKGSGLGSLLGGGAIGIGTAI